METEQVPTSITRCDSVDNITIYTFSIIAIICLIAVFFEFITGGGTKLAFAWTVAGIMSALASTAFTYLQREQQQHDETYHKLVLAHRAIVKGSTDSNNYSCLHPNFSVEEYEDELHQLENDNKK